NLHTYTGWGSIPYWNAFVAVLEMHGHGTFFDPRLDNAKQFPIAAENHFGHVTANPDLVTPKLPALHAYELSLRAPTTPPPPSPQRPAAAVGPAVGGQRKGPFRRRGRVRQLPRAADLHPARLEPGSVERGRHRQLRGEPLADAHAPHHSAGRAVVPPEGRLLPRRPVPDPAGRGQALQQGVPPGPDPGPGERPRAVPAVDIARPRSERSHEAPVPCAHSAG